MRLVKGKAVKNWAGALLLLGGLGLMGCDSREDSGGDRSPAPETENRRSPAVPAEPLDPTGENPAEPPDAGTHGVTDGAMVPAEPGTDIGPPPRDPGSMPEPGSGGQGGNEPLVPEAPDRTSPQE